MRKRLFALMAMITLLYGFIEFARSGEFTYVVASTLLATLVGVVYVKVSRCETNN